ncbi:MAG: hypothetical protein JW798_10250 [Prolixibacteraceae bacterium]|nr:hypothetical protein [Prolixibacteraceae bacterium]
MESSFTLMLLQIETVGPEGYKLIWVFLTLGLMVLVTWAVVRKKWHSRFWLKSIKVEALKNKVYHPETIILSVTNKQTKSIVIESVSLVFKGFKNKRSFVITRVGGKKIYPLFLEGIKKHTIVLALVPFYSKFPELEKMARLRIEVNIEKGRIYRSRFLLLKPTLFRSNR